MSRQPLGWLVRGHYGYRHSLLNENEFIRRLFLDGDNANIFVEGSLFAESGLRALRNMTSRMFLLSLFPGEGTDSGYELA